MADAEAGPSQHHKQSRLLLKLDNGTVITNHPRFSTASEIGIAVLRADAAEKAGLLSEADLFNLQAKLCELHAKLPEEGPLKSISSGSKRSFDAVVEVGLQLPRCSCIP
jgi:hypothetical protein